MKLSFLYKTFFVTVLVVLVFSNSGFGLDVYQPESQVQLVTEITGEGPAGGKPVLISSIVGPVQHIDDKSYIEFFNSNTGALFGSLSFSLTGTVSWDGKGVVAKPFQAEHLLIIPGFSIPADVLPVFRVLASDEPLVFELKSQAGGRSFIHRIQISSRMVSREEAVQNHWIKKDIGIASALYMIEAVDLQTGGMVVKQLWEPDSAWWLYEQTPLRRSWRIK